MHSHTITETNELNLDWMQLSIKMDQDIELSLSMRLKLHISIYHKNTFLYCSTFLMNQDCELLRFYILKVQHHGPFYLKLLNPKLKLSCYSFDRRINYFLKIKMLNCFILILYIEDQLLLTVLNFRDRYLTLKHILLKLTDIC